MTDTDPGVADRGALRDRVVARLDGLLEPFDDAVMEALGGGVESATIERVDVTAPQLILWLGDLGARAAVPMVSRLHTELVKRGPSSRPDADWAVWAAGVIESIRDDVLTSGAGGAAGRRVAVIGGIEPEIDTFRWSAETSGLEVVAMASALDASSDTRPDAVVVFVDRDAHAREVVEPARRAFPGCPVIALVAESDLTEQLAVGELVDGLALRPTDPPAVLGEVFRLLGSSGNSARVVAVGQVDAEVVRDWEHAGLAVEMADDAETAVKALRAERNAALVVVPSHAGEFRELLALVRARLELRRSPIVEILDDDEVADTRRRSDVRPDAVIPAPGSADDLVSAFALIHRRRREIGVIERELTRPDLPWEVGRTRAERVVAQAQRTRRPVSVALVTYGAEHPSDEIDRIQPELGREFRDGDVVIRRDPHTNVIVVDGLERRIAMRRFGAIAERYAQLGPAMAIAEYPFDGATFDLLLAACDDALERSEGRRTDPVVGVDWADGGAVGADVLVVEPDDSLAAVLAAGLERAGLRTRHLATGDEALDLLLDPLVRKPRLLVLAFDLPGFDGLTVLRRLERAGVTHRFEVVMIGSRTREIDIAAAFELGVADVIRTPLAPNIVVRQLVRLVSS